MQQSTMSPQQQMSAQQQTQQQQDDLINHSSQLPSATNFRFGNQNAVGQSSANTNEEFPPLNRNSNGEMGQDRSSSMAQGFAFGGQANGLSSVNPAQPSRNNGLLNALSGSNRITSNNRVASPASLSGNESASITWDYRLMGQACQLQDPQSRVADKA
jgi:CCR4-NOT transcription complex subunit 2